MSRLCLSCGLCCNGTLFTHIAPRAGEVEALAGTRLHLVTRRDGRVVIGLPCPALEGRRCTMYDERPAGCREFSCATARALAEGEVDEATAHARVEEALRRLAQVEARLPRAAEEPEPAVRRARRHGLVDGPEALRALDEWLDAWFR